MSHCLLFIEGDSHVVRGVKCDFVRVKFALADEYRAKGYKSSPEDLYKKKEVIELPEEKEPLSAESLFEIFSEDPERLTKDELVFLAKERYGIELHKRSKESTMIEKIKEAQ